MSYMHVAANKRKFTGDRCSKTSFTWCQWLTYLPSSTRFSKFSTTQVLRELMSFLPLWILGSSQKQEVETFPIAPDLQIFKTGHWNLALISPIRWCWHVSFGEQFLGSLHSSLLSYSEFPGGEWLRVGNSSLFANLPIPCPNTMLLFITTIHPNLALISQLSQLVQRSQLSCT